MLLWSCQGRGVEMVVRLGLYFGGLAVDYATGQAESTDRVRYRAAQLRCAPMHLGACCDDPRRAELCGRAADPGPLL